MADDRTTRGGGDRSRINVHEDYEKRYWSKKFAVSPEELERAVKKVGPMVRNVEKELAAAKST